MSTLSQFIRALHEGEQITVAEDGPQAESPASLRAAVALATGVAVRAAPGSAPQADPEVFTWAFTRLCHVCRLLAFRHLGEGEIAPALTPSAPATGTAAAYFAADVAFRLMPSAYGLAERTSAGDPLLAALRALADAWPLAAVGMAPAAQWPNS